MEFTKDIEFNKNIQEDEVCKITYHGKLFEIGSNEVSIVYGYGENWDNTNEKIMTKTNNGFTVELKILDNYDTFNFCFKNSNYEWDNNNGFNYISPIQSNILPIPDENIKIIDVSLDNSLTELLNQVFSLNGFEAQNDVIHNKLNEQQKENNKIIINYNSSKKNNSKFINTKKINKKYSNIKLNKKNKNQNISNFNLDDLVDELLVPIINCSLKNAENNSSETYEKINSFSESFEDTYAKINNQTINSNNDTSDLHEIFNDLDNLLNNIVIKNKKAKNKIQYVSNSYFDDLFEPLNNVEYNSSVDIENLISNINLENSTEDSSTDLTYSDLLNEVTNNTSINNSNKLTNNNENSIVTSSNKTIYTINIYSNTNKNDVIIDFSNINTSTKNINDLEITNFFYGENSIKQTTENNAPSTDTLETTKSINNYTVKNNSYDELSLIPTDDKKFVVSPRKLNKFYLIRKKIKLALYKSLVTIPKLLNGEYNSSNN